MDGTGPALGNKPSSDISHLETHLHILYPASQKPFPAQKYLILILSTTLRAVKRGNIQEKGQGVPNWPVIGCNLPTKVSIAVGKEQSHSHVILVHRKGLLISPICLFGLIHILQVSHREPSGRITPAS